MEKSSEYVSHLCIIIIIRQFIVIIIPNYYENLSGFFPWDFPVVKFPLSGLRA